MSDFAQPGANAFLNATALPATLYLQAHTGNPGVNGTANVAIDGIRQSFTRSAGSGGVATNTSQIQWLNVPDTESITHISVWGSSTGGICWFISDEADVGIFTGDSVTVVVSALSITIPTWT